MVTQAYHLIWTEWFKAIECVTSKGIKIKAPHKEGKHAIFMVDGSAPQMQGLGDFLLTQNDPLVSGIATKDPQIIVQHCSRICNIHCQWRRWMNLQLGAWGMNNRKSETGGRTSLHIHADWDLGPTNTNLNEQSHQATNHATGIHIPFAEAIDSAFEYDKQIARELQSALENCILKNHQNTLTHHFISNNNHQTSLHIERVDKADHICKEVTNIEFKLAAVLEEKKIAIENVNQL
ncbi:hypothetical protein BU17DRAFT_66302 [Hysterangium stoloniferum]|nr:hypothetical protein BU17DRAFT_66302 [Hysterangium stoloniferum]